MCNSSVFQTWFQSALKVLILFVLVPRGAAAGPDVPICEAPVDVEALTASDCPQVFRSQDADDASQPEELSVHERTITVVHRSSWQEPEPLTFDDLELVATAVPISDSECRPVALVRLDPEPAGIDCRPGTYAVTIDDSVGQHGRIVGIVDGVVLAEYDEELIYLKSSDTATPAWRMVWHAPFRFERPVSPSPPSRPKPKKRPRRRNKRRR